MRKLQINTSWTDAQCRIKLTSHSRALGVLRFSSYLFRQIGNKLTKSHPTVFVVVGISFKTFEQEIGENTMSTAP